MGRSSLLYVVVMQLLCSYYAVAMQLLCSCYVVAMRLLCIAMGLLCDCYAVAMRLLCSCFAVAIGRCKTNQDRVCTRPKQCDGVPKLTNIRYAVVPQLSIVHSMHNKWKCKWKVNHGKEL